MANTEKNKPEIKPDEFKRPVDKYLLGIYIALLVFSIIESYGASSFEVKADNIFGPLIRHLVTLGIGVLTTVIVSRINYRHIPMLTPAFVFVSVIIVILVFLFGKVSNDAVRSVSVLGFQLQSAEFVKLSAVLVIALVASKSQDKERKLSKKGAIIIAIVVAIFGGMLITQGLTNTALLMGISLAMMLLGGIRWKHLCAVGGVYFVLAIIMVGVHSMLKSDDSTPESEQEQIVASAGSLDQVTGEKKTVFRRSSTWTKRIEQWTNDTVPMYEQKVTDDNRQVFFARMAQGTGNIFGHGPGNSSVTSQLPLANIDYIFSVVVSDLGFAGGFAILLCYLSLLFRAGRIASKCRRAYPAMLIIGMSVFIVFSAMFHMAINTGLFPVSGQPLPLISKGGTSILITSLAFGIMFSVSRTAAMSSKKEENIAEKEMLPDDLQAENPGMLK